ncbi:MAG: DUF3568 family protein [Candidatus Omnitrophica bacterium]|nr:DUF3568 family protein [Candidatus Omnitrophota bacterium]MCB9721531.1 DUF3568 family protein [Candidatus Omnitrophota bacterium]
MKRYTSLLSLALLCLTVVCAQGCMLVAGAAVGAGGYAYATGALAKNVDANYADVHSAALDGLRDTGAFVVKETIGQSSADIHAESEDGTTIKIDIEALTERAAQIKIRYGTFGNEAESLRILNATMNRL